MIIEVLRLSTGIELKIDDINHHEDLLSRDVFRTSWSQENLEDLGLLLNRKLKLIFNCRRTVDTTLYTVSQKNWATFIFTVTLSNVGRF